jgi:putative DNA primase/helicase
VQSKLIPSSPKNPCPVCDRTKDSDCRISQDGNLVHCKTFPDGTEVEGWHYLGRNKLNFQGMYRRKEEQPAALTKTPRQRETREFPYPDRQGKPLVKVTRMDNGQGEKKFFQSHWDGQRYVPGNPEGIRKQVPVYNFAAAREAIEQGETIFLVEGESAVHALSELGIVSITTIGGSGGYANYGDYREDLAGARLVLCPDRDANGLKYMANFERDFPDQIEGYYLAGTAELWRNPQGGMDIDDDIRDHRMTKEQILAKVIDAVAYRDFIPPTELVATTDEKIDGGKPRFLTSWDGGLQYESFTEGSQKRVLVGNHLAAIANTENPEGGDTGVLLEFRNRKGVTKRLQIAHAGLVGDGLEILKELATRGYYYHRKQRNLLLDYLFGLGEEVTRTIVIADKSGWVNDSFLTPAKTYGDSDLCFRDPEPDNSLIEFKGTIEGWKSSVAAKCSGNSRLIFALGCAFAAPLLDIAQIESGGFHLVGTTSIGKTTALNLAASVAGLKNIPNWRSTANALEGKAAEFNHMLLPLDEIGQADPIAVGASAYMLGNGQGKNRMGKTLATIKPKTWELLFLSTGEVSMDDYLRKAGMTVKGGMEARMPSFPADAGAGHGVFENLHGYSTAKEFVQALEEALGRQQGHGLDAYLTDLVKQRQAEGFDKQLREQVHQVAGTLSQKYSDSAVGRVAVRLALVQVGLEFAHGCGLLPFPIEQCGWAVAQMLAAWLQFRGGEGSIEIKEACNRIEYLFVSNQYSDRIAKPGSSDTVRNLLAFQVGDLATNSEEFLVPSAVFDRELAAGVDRDVLAQELARRGWLKPSTEAGRYSNKRRIDGRQGRYFVFYPFWNLGETIFPVGTVGTVGTEAKTVIQREFISGLPVPTSEIEVGTLGTSANNTFNLDVPTVPTSKNMVGTGGSIPEPLRREDYSEVFPPFPPFPAEKHVSLLFPENLGSIASTEPCQVGSVSGDSEWADEC